MKKLLLIVFGLFVSSYLEGQVVYTLGNTGYYTQFADGGGIFSNAGESELGMWANNGNKKIVAWRQFQTNGTNNGSARSLQVGDVFTVQVNATSAYGSIGFSLNSSPSTSTWEDRHSNSRLYIQVEGLNNSWYVNSAAGNQTLSYNVGATGKDYKFTIHITSYTTCDIEMYVNGVLHTRLFNVTMNGTAGVNLTHFALYMNDDWNGSSNQNIYWKQTTTHNATGVSNLGYYLTSGNYTPGLITDGLVSASNSSNSINAVNIGGGSGTSVTLNQNNIYTGLTTINANATAIANHANAFGTTDGSIIVSNGGRIQLSGGVSVGTEGLTLNGVGISHSGSLQNISEDNSWAGNIISNSSRINSDSGLLTIIGNVNSGSVNTYIGGNGNVKITGLFTGTLNSGDGAIFKDGNGILTLTNDNLQLTGLVKNTSGTINLGDGGTTGAVTGDIINNASLVFHRSNDYTYAGVISGTGILTKQGAGKLTLSGTNTYSGSTTVSVGTLEITGSIDCNSMTVASGATLIVNGNTVKMSSLINNGTIIVKAGHTLEVTNAITNNSGAIITVEDDGSLLQTHTGVDANSGTGTYKTYRTTRTYKEYDYNYWSSPVVGETLGDALVTNSTYSTTDNTTPAPGGSNSGRIYELNPILFNDANDNGWDDNLDEWVVAPTSTVMSRGKGYIAHGAGADFPFNTNYYSGSYTQYVYFEGTNVNNGEFTVTLTHDSDGSTSESDNLIGNPYPSVLDATTFYNANDSKITSSAYFWTHDNSIGTVANSPWVYSFTNSDYATLNLESNVTSASNNVPVTNIASGQGFIVQLKNTASDGIITFNNTMRSSGNNDHFLKLAQNTENGVLWLNLTDATGLFRQVAVGFHNEALDSYEEYDSPRMMIVDEPDFYTFATDSPKKLSIQGLATFEDSKTIPVGLTTTYQGTYEITLDHTQGIFSQTQKIYLEDTYQDIIHNLSDGAYTFTQTTGTDINDRFILRFTNTQLGHEEAVLEDLKPYPNPTKGLLNIAYSGSEPLQITLYNQVGHKVGTYEGVQVLDLSQLAQGMYFAKIANSQGSVTRKILLE